MIRRAQHEAALTRQIRRNPVVAILGARQVGKTTLARRLISASPAGGTYLDLEDPTDLGRLADSMLALRGLKGLVVIDEVQRAPGLFPILRVLADRKPLPARFLVLGSASPELLRQSSETLAGRIHFHHLSGFSASEVGISRETNLWVRGGFPRSFLARSGAESFQWRMDFIRTFLERDIPALGSRTPPATLRRFWTMLAHYHGQLWNGAELSRAFGVAHTTVRDYLDLLSSAFVVRQLQPWHENISKRQVRAPKVYVSDSGVLHALLAIHSLGELEKHPKLGASWEGFALVEVLDRLGAQPEECYFWATHGGAELDLLVVRGSKRRGFEFKRSSTPVATRSMHQALSDLKLDSLDLIYPGERTFPLGPRMRAVGFARLLDDVPRLSVG